MIKHPTDNNVTYLDEELIEKIVASVPEVFFMKHVANLNKIPYQTLHHWMTHGNKDIKAGIEDSIYAKLVKSYYHKRSEALKEKIAQLLAAKNASAITWLLERCYREEFGVKSEFQKRMEDFILNYLPPLIDQGGLEHVKEKLEEIYTSSD